jgi:apolipoprotein N-acyltransferase
VAVALSIPPFGWWPLAWLGYAALAWSLWRSSPRRRFAAGAAFGLGQYLISIWWVTEFNGFGYGVLVLVVALFSAVAALFVPGRRFRGVALGLPALLVLAEWTLDRFPLGGFPLGSAALGQTRGPLIPLARLGGSLGILAGTVTAGVIVAGLVIGALRIVRGRPGRLTPLVAAAGATAVLVATVLGGLWSPGGAPVGSPLRIALVQGGGPRGTRAVTTDPNVVFQRHLNASAGLQPPLDLVVWPEGILQTTGDFRNDPGATNLAQLAQRLNATVVAGVEEDIGATRYTNKVVAWRPDGTVADTYEKNHLVPFGEYVPWRSFLNHFVSLNLVPRDAIAGNGPGILSTPVGRLGVMISYEVFFDGRARGAVQAGGRVLLVPTNTASYSDSEVPTQELAAAQLRAWETGRVVLQVTPTGYSAVVGPAGQVRQRSVLGAQTNVEATVQPRQGNTIYVDLGDVPLAVGGLLLAAGAWVLAVPDPWRAVRRIGRRRPRSPSSPART